jgi:hypothetical protein
MKEIPLVFSLPSTHLWRRGPGERRFSISAPRLHEPAVTFPVECAGYGLGTNGRVFTLRDKPTRGQLMVL